MGEQQRGKRAKGNPPPGTTPDDDEERYMRLALREAARGLGRTSPNPAVGAVIVSPAGEILATGWHRAAGQPHAEIEALRALEDPDTARGATIYITLEPCSTHGRTPPCTDAILRAGLARVVVGATDPNPAHAGRGLEILRAAGVEVRAGVLADDCARLNRPFNQWITTGLPWVIAKAALSLDGRVARPPGEGQWITGPAARAHAHRRLRARTDAILVGAGTVRADNPRLTVRGAGAGRRQPWRVVLTRSGELPADAHLFNDEWRERTLVFRDQPLEETLRELGARGVTSVLIEGGADVLAQALNARLVDEAYFYLAPLLIGIGGATLEVGASVRIVSPCYEHLGPDLLCSGELAYGTRDS